MPTPITLAGCHQRQQTQNDPAGKAKAKTGDGGEEDD
jgi:hypothetical protein